MAEAVRPHSKSKGKKKKKKVISTDVLSPPSEPNVVEEEQHTTADSLLVADKVALPDESFPPEEVSSDNQTEPCLDTKVRFSNIDHTLESSTDTGLESETVEHIVESSTDTGIEPEKVEHKVESLTDTSLEPRTVEHIVESSPDSSVEPPIEHDVEPSTDPSTDQHEKDEIDSILTSETVSVEGKDHSQEDQSDVTQVDPEVTQDDTPGVELLTEDSHLEAESEVVCAESETPVVTLSPVDELQSVVEGEGGNVALSNEVEPSVSTEENSAQSTLDSQVDAETQSTEENSAQSTLDSQVDAETQSSEQVLGNDNLTNVSESNEDMPDSGHMGGQSVTAVPSAPLMESPHIEAVLPRVASTPSAPLIANPCDSPQSSAIQSTVNPMQSQEQTMPSAPMSVDLTQTRVIQPTVHPMLDESILENIGTMKPFTREQLHTLYYNEELDGLEKFVDGFLQLPSYETHAFYEILMNNYRARNKHRTAEMDLRAKQNDYERLQGLVWSTTTHSLTAQGMCQDKVKVAEQHIYEKAVFHENVCLDITRVLSNIRTDLHDDLSLHAYSTQLSRLQVESFIHNLIEVAPVLRNIPRNAPVEAYPSGHRNANYEKDLEELRVCVSILFGFQRKPIKDEHFIEDSRTWLDRLVGILLRVASFGDHMFLLSHILRCPAGIGRWGAQWVQPPILEVTYGQTMFGSPVLDHFLAMLAMVLLPVRGREEYLRQLGVEMTPERSKSNPWTFLDSDGEEEDEDPSVTWKYLHENDLVAILDQFNLEAMFRHILFVEKQDETFVYDVRRTSEHSMLRLFAFSISLIELLGKGLNNFTQTRYRQFNKRLGNMIRKTMNFASDHWENFQSTVSLPLVTLTRLQVEFDQCFYRSLETILSAQRLGSWQFIAGMPFSNLSIEMMWKLVWLLHFGKTDEVITPERCRTALLDADTRREFEDVLTNMSMSESVYLLTALAGMAQGRSSKDFVFIQTIVEEIYEIAYVTPHTREFCSKTGRELLSCIATVHPFVMSDLLQKVKESVDKVGMVSLYLFRELPLLLWQLSDNDMEILQVWVHDKDMVSPENQLARLVLSGVNWGFNQQQNALFLPLSLHRKVGLLLVDAHRKHVPSKALGMLVDGVKQVASVVKSAATDQQLFITWIWDLALRLRLHKQNQCRNSLEFFGDTPDLKRDPLLSKLQLAVQDGSALACYVSLMMTSVGHNHVEFCCEGLAYLQTLVSQTQYQAVIQVLSSVAHLFYHQAHYLLGNDRFSAVLQSLLSPDPAYSTYAMSFLFSSEIPEQVTKFICMVQTQLQSGSSTECDTSEVLEFWINALINLNKWYTDKNILCSLDSLLQTAFVTKGGDKVASDTIFKAYEHMLHYQKGQNVLSSFMSWLATGSSMPSFLDKISPKDFPWFAYFVLLAESRWEIETKLWSGFQEEIIRNPRCNLDHAIKKISSSLKLENGPALHRLCIYRWGVVAMEIEASHPVNPLLWQNFFHLFLQRPVLRGVPMKSGVGEKFFESTANITLLKKMKKRLSEIIEHHHHEATSSPTTDDTVESDSDGATALPEQVKTSGMVDFHTKLISVFQSFKLWLDEPRLHDGNLYLPGLPVQYGADRLQRIFQGDKHPWVEYVDMDKVEYQIARSVQEWTSNIFPVTYGNFGLSLQDSHRTSAKDRILDRLKRKGSPLQPPSLLPLKAPVPSIPPQLLTDRDGLMYALKSDFEELTNYAKTFSHRVSKHIELDCNYGELLPDLFGNEETEVVLNIPCRKSFKPNHMCEGPAVVRLRYEEKRRREIVNRKIGDNRSEYRDLLSESFLPPPQAVCISAVHVENAITALITMVKTEGCDASTVEQGADVGRSLFYHIVLLVSDVTNHYPPCRQFFSSCLDVLGQEFIAYQGSETSRLLLTILSTPLMAGGLAVHFTPNSSPCEFVRLYEKVIPLAVTAGTDTAFMLFTKFDIQQWLETFKPVLTERQQFAAILVDALCICGAKPEDKLQKIFEIVRTHLKFVLNHQFPELYGDILVLLLKGSCEGKLQPAVWDSYLLTLGCVSYSSCGSYSQQSLHDYANNRLSLQQVSETLEWLGNYFQQLRSSDASREPFGLYPCWSNYLKPISCVIGFLCGCLITRGTVSYGMSSNQSPESVICRIWQELVRVFSPWIAPLDKGAVTHSAWVESDSTGADIFVTVFVEASLLLHKQFEGTLPAYSHNILSLLFDYYSRVIACPGCPEYVLQLFHHKFSRLPWEQFRPSVESLDLMTKLCDQSHPDSPGKYSCLQFLATIIPSLPWIEMVQFYCQYEPPEMTMRFHAYLLQLLVQIFQESSVLELPEGDALSQLALIAEQFYWHFLDDVSFKTVIEIFLLNCDPRCVLVERTAHSAQALRLLRLAAGFLPSTDRPVHPSSFDKQRCYVQTHVQLISKCTRLKTVNIGNVQLVLTNLMTDCETVLGSVNNGQAVTASCVAVMSDILSLLNTCDPNELVVSSILTTFIQWLESSPCSILLLPTITAVGKALTFIPQMVQLVECCIETYFNSGLDDWGSILSFLEIPYGHQYEFLAECLNKGCFMTVFLHVLHQLSLCESYVDEKAQLITLVEWTIKVKPSVENEAKLILWYHKVGQLCLHQLQNGSNIRPVIELFIPAVNLMGEDKSTAGILGTLGFGKKSALSIRFRLLCKSLSVFLMAQLPSDNSVRCHRQAPGHILRYTAGNVKPTQKAIQTIGSFLTLKTKKEYKSFYEHIDFVMNFTQDPNHSLSEVMMLVSHLSSVLFPEVKYLCAVKNV